ncbi:MAG TPA: flagellar basal-body rod protein FlgF [Magnetospirillaceae bacterium]|nr:flagellar basal-body rod protein FlgF [Magnetospirillaceae bacterium]
MIRGWYTGASGMMAQQIRLDAVANNLANVDTNGFKRETAVHKAFAQLLLRRLNDDGVHIHPLGSGDMAPIIGKLGTGVETNELYVEFQQGALKQTENEFDLALEGKGFFTVQTPNGERYTRNGGFILGREGILMTKGGYPVLGETGPVRIKANNFQVDPQGRIWVNRAWADDDPTRLVGREQNEWEDTFHMDTLRIADFRRERHLDKQGTSLYAATEESGDARPFRDGLGPKVFQGFVEASNVNPVTEMVRMIEVNRAYEANQKTIQSQDAMLGKLINEVVRV